MDQKSMDKEKPFNLVPLLDYIDSDAPDPAEPYDSWYKVGMALKHEGYPVEVWDQWSRTGKKYKPGECFKKWESFKEEKVRLVSGAYITMLAKEGGWEGGKAAGYSVINDFKDEYLEQAATFKEPGEDWNPSADLLTFLKTLFRDGEYVNITLPGEKPNGKGKYYPSTNGKNFPVSDLIKKLEGGAILEHTKDKGAWVCLNPTDGKGRSNGNITAFRYALIESDDMALHEQVKAIHEMFLPVATLVFSGGKSVHAAVKVDAKNEKEYRERVNFLYTICKKFGFSLDTQNKNPSRLSRLPGVVRSENGNTRKQFLMETNIGAENWDKWIQWVKDNVSQYPAPVTMQEIWDNPQELPPVLVPGVLREHERAMIASESKAGKSFLAIELSIALATGGQWLGIPCNKAATLYINLEIDGKVCNRRFRDVCQAMKIDGKIENLFIMNLRDQPMERFYKEVVLALKRIKRGKGVSVGCIVIDPIYILEPGEENSAKDVRTMLLNFSEIGRAAGAAVVFIHHFSKGGASFYRQSMNLASGSNLFNRYPDSIISMVRLEPPKNDESVDPERAAFKIDFTVRSVSPHKPIYVYFDWPIHTVDTTGTLEQWEIAGTIGAAQKKGRETQTENAERRREFIRNMLETEGPRTLEAIAIPCRKFNKNGKPPDTKTIRNDINTFYEMVEGGDPVRSYEIIKNMVYTREQAAKMKRKKAGKGEQLTTNDKGPGNPCRLERSCRYP